jgi:uncharacterized membrane protein
LGGERYTRALLLAGACALVALACLAPWLHSPWLYALARPLCHQRPERCFQLGGLPLAFCARCFGIYAGAALALLLGLRGRVRPFLAALAVILLDVLSEAAGLRPAWLAGRFLTGLLTGALAAPLVLEWLLEAASGAPLATRHSSLTTLLGEERKHEHGSTTARAPA